MPRPAFCSAPLLACAFYCHLLTVPCPHGLLPHRSMSPPACAVHSQYDYGDTAMSACSGLCPVRYTSDTTSRCNGGELGCIIGGTTSEFTPSLRLSCLTTTKVPASPTCLHSLFGLHMTIMDVIADTNSSAAQGRPAKRQRASRKGQPRCFSCPYEGCDKKYSRAEHLTRHQLNRVCSCYAVAA